MLPDIQPDGFGVRSYDREKWTARHALMCDLHVAGQSNNEIAETLECSHVTVCQILGDERSKAYIRAQRDGIAAGTTDVLKKLELYALEAVDELVREMRFGVPSDKIKQSASTAILDRLGYSPIRKEIHANVQNPLTPEHVDRMEKVLDQAKEAKGRFVFGLPSGETNDKDP